MPVRRVLTSLFRAEIEALVHQTAGARIERLQARIDTLERQVTELGGSLEASTQAARKAAQQAARATATAEAAVDAVTAIEMDMVAAAEGPPAEPEAADPGPSANVVPEAVDDDACRVVACSNKPRRRGFCGRHYAQLRAGELLGFVDTDGVARLSVDGSAARWHVGADHAGKAVTEHDGEIAVDGVVVPAEPQT